MTALYDENSFYLLDRGEASRSLSGFSFERINDDGTFGNRFQGWVWQQQYLKVIQPNRCVSLKLIGAKFPYLDPVECDRRALSILNLPAEIVQIFWTVNATSSQFRVLWLDEEIGRCGISAGTCDFYVP